MLGNPWFPLKLALPDGAQLGRLRHAGEDWQIYERNQGGHALIARSGLAERWVAAGLLEALALRPLSFGGEAYGVLESGAGKVLAPVGCGQSPRSKADALAFAVSLRETRKLLKDVPLHDALYVERCSRLLPTWTVSESVDDRTVLGRWLTGGVPVSVSSYRRITSLMGWLGEKDVAEVIEAGGYPVQGRREGSGGGTLLAMDRQEDLQSDQRGDESQRVDKNGRRPAGDVFRLPGRAALESFFNEHVIDIVANAERYKALGIDFPTAICLHGPPGCGKTFAAERLGEFLDWPMFSIDSNSVGSPYIHDTARKVSQVFDKAMESAPSIIVIDEMESYLSDRQIHQSTGLHHVEEVAEFLRRIPEATGKHVLVVGMTNRLEMIDPAILRRGRFDHVIEVGMPSREEVDALLTSLLSRLPLDEGLDSAEAIYTLTGRPLSDVAYAVREASRLAARAGKHALDQASLDQAVSLLPKRADEPKGRRIGFVWE